MVRLNQDALRRSSGYGMRGWTKIWVLNQDVRDSRMDQDLGFEPGCSGFEDGPRSGNGPGCLDEGIGSDHQSYGPRSCPSCRWKGSRFCRGLLHKPVSCKPKINISL